MLGRPPGYALKRLDPESEAFRALVEESRLEGFWMLVRLADGWEGGRNRFSRRGETLLAAWSDKGLAGVCGLNVDPYAELRREGRVRHLYVRQDQRRTGVGTLLLKAIIDKARLHFPVLNVRAPDGASAFYEALGFKPVQGDEFVTHRMTLKKPARRRKGAV